MRFRTKCWTRAWKTVALSLALAALPAGGADAGERWLWRDTPAASSQSGSIVYRPAFPRARPKTFYLSNYAGVNYPPLFRRAPLQPTGAVYRGQPGCPDCAAGRHAPH